MKTKTLADAGRRRCLCCAVLVPGFTALLAAGCGEKGDDKAASTAPREITAATACELDGMLLADYPGPKAQIHYAGVAAPHFFCDTVEMFTMLLKPEQVRRVLAVYTQDMALADWDQPRGHWIDAKAAWYVRGSKRRGAMGKTLASFGTEEGAKRFAAQWGGQVLKFSEVTPQMVDLTGGTQGDGRM